MGHYVAFERIHPFRDSNSCVGMMVLFKECLKFNIVAFIIEINFKIFYYRGLKERVNEIGYLMDTCLTAQNRFKHIWTILESHIKEDFI